jgi:DNA-binding phage protein
MKQELNLKRIDADGAIREAAHDATESLDDGDTRIDFLKKAGLAGGAVMGGGALLAALSPGAAMAKGGKGRPPAKFGKGDIGILNYALTLEYLESAFYNETTHNVNRHNFMKNQQAQVFLKETTKDENAHVAFLKKALGKKAVAAPKFDFGPATRSESKFLKYAFTFENTGVHAYLGQALNIQSPAYVSAALSITAVEARHASVVGLILNRNKDGISPDGAFNTDLTAGQVLKAVEGLGVIK